LLHACGNENRDNIAFLANSRVKPLYRPNLLYLMSGLAKLLRSTQLPVVNITLDTF
jgi:hypothetical protein